MKKKHIENYLVRNGMNPNDRLQKNNGGQYLINFLDEFARYVRQETINETVGVIKKMRE